MTRIERRWPRPRKAARLRRFMGLVRWRVVDLCQWLYEQFRVKVAKQTLSRELRKMGIASFRLVVGITRKQKGNPGF
jgi:hypothetical protein